MPMYSTDADYLDALRAMPRPRLARCIRERQHSIAHPHHSTSAFALTIESGHLDTELDIWRERFGTAEPTPADVREPIFPTREGPASYCPICGSMSVTAVIGALTGNLVMQCHVCDTKIIGEVLEGGR